MRKIFYTSIFLLSLFGFLKVYFIMPFPVSQQSNTISLAYILFSYRWVFRIVIGAFIVWSFIPAWKRV